MLFRTISLNLDKIIDNPLFNFPFCGANRKNVIFFYSYLQISKNNKDNNNNVNLLIFVKYLSFYFFCLFLQVISLYRHDPVFLNKLEKNPNFIQIDVHSIE